MYKQIQVDLGAKLILVLLILGLLADNSLH